MHSEETTTSRREARFEQVWYGDQSPPFGWLLASWMYRVLSAARRLLYQCGLRRRFRAPVPTIVVGNVTVGGTGKTPVVIWLTQLLREHGYSPGVISRGYGGNSKNAQLVEVDTPASICGDEPLMMARRGLMVAVCSDRALAVDKLLEIHCDVIIADDGLQHYRLHRDIEIAVVDGTRGLGNGKLLPAGPLREPASRLKRVDHVLINGGVSQYGIAMSLEGAQLVNSASGTREPIHDWREREVHAVAGIGNPERFFCALEQAGMRITRHPFSDHHPFTPDDLKFGDDFPIVTTEKDATRIQPARNIWSLPVDAVLPKQLAESILQQLKKLT